MKIERLPELMRFAIDLARRNEPTSIDARARCFIATLAGALHEADPQFAAELFLVLLNVKPEAAPCVES